MPELLDHLKSIKWLFSFDGRSNRLQFWQVYFGLALAFVPWVLLLNVPQTEMVAEAIGLFGSIPFFWVMLASQIRRWHDRDKSAWWSLMSAIPWLGWVWVVVEVGALKGTDGPNKYGTLQEETVLPDAEIRADETTDSRRFWAGVLVGFTITFLIQLLVPPWGLFLGPYVGGIVARSGGRGATAAFYSHFAFGLVLFFTGGAQSQFFSSSTMTLGQAVVGNVTDALVLSVGLGVWPGLVLGLIGGWSGQAASWASRPREHSGKAEPGREVQSHAPEQSSPLESTPDLAGQSEAPEPQFVGIGGWLILPAIGLVLGPIIGVVGLITGLALYTDVEAAGYGGVYALEILVQIALLAFLIYTATRFFGKKRNAPAYCITLFVLGVAASFILLVIELGAGAEVFAIESGKALAQGTISAAIWIPYFRVSKRVKATFVN